LTGAEVVHLLLLAAGVCGVEVERLDERPEDDDGDDEPGADAHYDRRHRVIRLAPSIHDGTTVGAAAVAAHECGHAVQHAVRMRTFRVRAAIAPAAITASWGWLLLLIVAMVLGSALLGALAVGLYTVVVLFELVTLPVEVDASRR